MPLKSRTLFEGIFMANNKMFNIFSLLFICPESERDVFAFDTALTHYKFIIYLYSTLYSSGIIFL
nr:hypothetical protein [Mucilaginibacter sp. X4EP1]